MNQVYSLWNESLRLQGSSVLSLESSPGLTGALIIFFLAAVSKGLSDAGVMIINRVTRFEFLRGLLGGSVMLGLAALTWAGCIWLALRGAMRFEVGFQPLLVLVLTSYAPLVFGVFVIIPHAGLLWSLILRIWMLLITVAGLHQHFQVPVLWAVAASGVGWLLFQLVGELFRSWLERLRLALLGRQRWVRPKDAAVALLEKRMAGE